MFLLLFELACFAAIFDEAGSFLLAKQRSA
jgi:hypothetical protein